MKKAQSNKSNGFFVFEWFYIHKHILFFAIFFLSDIVSAQETLIEDSSQQPAIYISGEVELIGFDENFTSVQIVSLTPTQTENIVSEMKLTEANAPVTIKKTIKSGQDVKQVMSNVIQPPKHFVSNSVPTEGVSSGSIDLKVGCSSSFGGYFKFIRQEVYYIFHHNNLAKRLFINLNLFQNSNISFDSYSIRPPPQILFG